MNDKELTELAAKAFGVAAEGFSPLTDDGDAFRLAVSMFRDIHFWYFDNSVSVGNEQRFVCGDDPCVAARRAIVYAAALVGESAEVKP